MNSQIQVSAPFEFFKYIRLVAPRHLLERGAYFKLFSKGGAHSWGDAKSSIYSILHVTMSVYSLNSKMYHKTKSKRFSDKQFWRFCGTWTVGKRSPNKDYKEISKQMHLSPIISFLSRYHEKSMHAIATDDLSISL